MTPDGIQPSDAHVTAIKKYPMPTTVKEVQSCLGLFSYFRRFVPSFSKIARPLQNLIRRSTDFAMNEECIQAFETLKSLLVAAPVLAIYDPKRETELHCDASSRGFGAALLQRQQDGKLHPIAYYSKSTTKDESKYHSFELETLAILYALGRFRVYLEGIEFTVVTDCNSLAMTLEKKQLNPRIARWALEFEKFTFKKKHRPGVSMSHVDALSRCHIKKGIEETPTTAVEDEIGFFKQEMKCRVYAVDYEDVQFRLQVTQNRDPKIIDIRERLEAGNVENYLLEDGIVYRRKEEKKLFYVPTEMEEKIIQMVHEKLAHQSIDKCYAKMVENYWFPQMRVKIEKFIV